MIFGDKTRFAIEIEIDPDKRRDPELAPWLFGKIRWWACDQQIGRYEADTSIRDVAVEVERILTFRGKRDAVELLDAEPEELFRTFVHALFDDHGQSDEQVRLDDERYRRFLVKPAVDVFDQWDIFLIEGEDRARLIWRHNVDEVVRSCDIARGELDGVLGAFMAALPGGASER